MEDQIRGNDNIMANESTNDYVSDDDQVSDCESLISTISDEDRKNLQLFEYDDLLSMDEHHAVFWTVERRFMLGMGDLARNIEVMAVHKKDWSRFLRGQVRLKCFEVCARALANQRGGGEVVKYAWHGGSKEEIARIMSHGFGHREICDQFDPYAHGLCLSSVNFPVESLRNSMVDEDGLRHMLLCRVLIGNTEVIESGSTQFHPSSRHFNSGVDNANSPRKYIIWSTNMNTHILPEYIISFKAHPYSMGLKLNPTSPWVPIPTLISELSKLLPNPVMGLIKKHHKDFKDKNISRAQLIQILRRVAGDDLLIMIIKSCQANGYRLKSD